MSLADFTVGDATGKWSWRRSARKNAAAGGFHAVKLPLGGAFGRVGNNADVRGNHAPARGEAHPGLHPAPTLPGRDSTGSANVSAAPSMQLPMLLAGSDG